MTAYRLKDSLGYLINRASRTIRKCLNQELIARGYPVSGEQFAVLVHLWDQDGQSQQQLADELSKDKTTMTRLISGMEAQNLVKRVRDKNDKRQRLICLTPKGRKLMNELTVMAQGILRTAQAGIDVKEMAICRKVLEKVYETLALRFTGRMNG